MKRILLLLILGFSFLPLYVKAENFVPDQGEFEAAIIMQPKSHHVIYAYNPEKAHVPASLTKLLTGITVIETDPVWDKVVSMRAEDEVGGGRLRVASGATLRIKDLLYSAITASANNAAMALSRVSGMSRKRFIEKMNLVAQRIGAKNTRVYDAAGMEVKNTTTAFDMALIAETAFNHTIMKSAATVGRYKFQIRNTGEVKSIKNTGTTFLEDKDVWVTGGKTGFLYESRYNLVSRLQPYRNGVHDPKYEIIVVVLGAPTKAESFSSAKRLAKWAWSRPELFVEPIQPEKLLSRQLTHGMTSREVKTLQYWLSFDKEVYPEGIISGFFGPLTLRAVQRFQIKYHVVSSPSKRGYGVVGPATRAQLYDFYLKHDLATKTQGVKEVSKKKNVEVTKKGLRQVLVYGQNNEQVKLLQSWLSEDKTVYPEGIISGFFGPLTLRAVQRFQLKYGIVKNKNITGYGIVGPATRAKLQALHI